MLNIIICLLHTAMRRSEVLHLKWNNISFEDEIITLTITKSGKAREIPISSKLMAILKELYVNKVSDYVFVNPRTYRPYNTIQKAFADLCREAKIEGITPRRLRHTACTRIDEVEGLRTAQAILGHSTAKTTERYTHPNIGRKRRAITYLETYVDLNNKDKETN